MSNLIASLRRDLALTGASGIALLLLFLSVVTNRYRIEFLPFRPQLEHLALGIVLVVLGYLVIKRRAHVQFQRADAMLGLYLAVALAASLLSAGDVQDSVQYWVRMAASVVVYFFARWLIAGGNAHAAVGLAVKVILIWGVLEALFGIASWFSYPLGINLGVDEYPLGVRGPGGILCNFALTMYGTLWEPNVFGGVMMTVVLIAATLFCSNEYARWRKWLGIGIAVMLAALALNASRGALGALALGLVLIVVFGRGMARREKVKWALAAVGLVVVVTIPSGEITRGMMQLPSAPGLALRAPCAQWIADGMPRGTGTGDPEFDPATGPEGGAAVFQRILEGQTLASRWLSYQHAVEDWWQRPWLGNGANTFGQKYTTTAHTPGWISNVLLMSLHDTGVIGTLVLLGWIGWFAWRIVVALRGTRSVTSEAARAGWTLTLALGIGLLCLFVTYQVTTMLWFGLAWWLAAVIEASTNELKARQAPITP